MNKYAKGFRELQKKTEQRKTIKNYTIIIILALFIGCVIGLIWQHKAEAKCLDNYIANIPEGKYSMCIANNCDIYDLPKISGTEEEN